jgi:2-oxoglutarate dehydrogenase E2 component (dihydrolipoamide succinyltransferase)
MPKPIVVPEMGESVVTATVARWLKEPGAPVAAGEGVVELETEKVNLEVAAETAGILAIARQPGDEVRPGDILGTIDEAAGIASERATGAALALEPGQTTPPPPAPTSVPAPEAPPRAPESSIPPAPDPRPPAPPVALRREERVRMSKRRQTIARRLVESLQTAAMLTTFNEVDMSALQELRARQKEAVTARHGLFPGLTAFFVRAAIGALRAFPRLNAEIQGDEMVLKHYYDIGVAVGAEEGLVVPVIRDADRLDLLAIEAAVRALAKKAADRALGLEDLRGGTFTITNGGVFGSLLSTPILNPPQVGILGLHKIEDRPVVKDGRVVVRPMMYVALSYDHRIVDGREAVQFLTRVKELIELPGLFLLEG